MSINALMLSMFCIGIIFIIAQNIYFLVKVIKKCKLQFAKQKLNRVMVTSAVFSLIPAVTTGLSFLPLASYLGAEFVLLKSIFTGSLQDNILAAETSLNIFGLNLNNYPFSSYILSVLFWVMTFSGLASVAIFIVLAIIKKQKTKTINNSNTILEEEMAIGTDEGKEASTLDVANESPSKSNSKFKQILKLSIASAGNLMYIGIMGVYFAKYLLAKGNENVKGDGAGFISIVSVLLSALTMAILLKISEKYKMEKLKSMVLPISILITIAFVGILSIFLPDYIMFWEWRG